MPSLATDFANSSFNTPNPNKTRDSKMASATAPVPLDLNGCDGIDQLTASEQSLCSNLRIYPRAYMAIKQVIIRESEKRGRLKRREARALVRIDVNKLGKIYDFFVSKGWIKS
jgi:transcriptional adapter 2-alpha